jgi:hypothetical protein
MNDSMDNPEVARIIAEQVAAQVDMRVKLLAEKKAAKKKEKKRKHTAVSSAVRTDGDEKTSPKRCGGELTARNEALRDIDGGVPMKRRKSEGLEEEDGTNVFLDNMLVGNEKKSNLNEEAVAVSNLVVEESVTTGSEKVVGETSEVDKDRKVGVEEDEVVEFMDGNDDESSDESSESGSGSGSGGGLKRKKDSDSDSSTSSSCDGSGSSSSSSKSYRPDEEISKSVRSPKMVTHTARGLIGEFSMEAFRKDVVGSVVNKVFGEKQMISFSAVGSAGSTPSKVRGTDLSLAGSEVHDLEEIPSSLSKVQGWKSVAVAEKESEEYDSFLSFGVEDVQLAKKKHIRAFNLYSVQPTSGDLYEMRIPLHKEVQLKLKTDIVGKGIRGMFDRDDFCNILSFHTHKCIL